MTLTFHWAHFLFILISFLWQDTLLLYHSALVKMDKVKEIMLLSSWWVTVFSFYTHLVRWLPQWCTRLFPKPLCCFPRWDAIFYITPNNPPTLLWRYIFLYLAFYCRWRYCTIQAVHYFIVPLWLQIQKYTVVFYKCM